MFISVTVIAFAPSCGLNISAPMRIDCRYIFGFVPMVFSVCASNLAGLAASSLARSATPNEGPLGFISKIISERLSPSPSNSKLRAGFPLASATVILPPSSSASIETMRAAAPNWAVMRASAPASLSGSRQSTFGRRLSGSSTLTTAPARSPVTTVTSPDSSLISAVQVIAGAPKVGSTLATVSSEIRPPGAAARVSASAWNLAATDQSTSSTLKVSGVGASGLAGMTTWPTSGCFKPPRSQ